MHLLTTDSDYNKTKMMQTCLFLYLFNQITNISENGKKHNTIKYKLDDHLNDSIRIKYTLFYMYTFNSINYIYNNTE